MLSSTYQGNANQNHNETSSHLSEWLLSKSQGMEKREPLVHSWWECKLAQLLWNSPEIPQTKGF